MEQDTRPYSEESMNKKKHSPPVPPRWATRLLQWYCKPELLEDLEGDLHEYFERNVKIKGARTARWIYLIDVLKFLRLYTIRKPKFFKLFIHWIMIASYLKTSGRSILRNKMFSSINIFGLAVSMTIALLLMAMLSDLFSYDSFHAKKERIYRVNTNDVRNEGSEMNLASTSALAGKKIKETFSGVEALTLMRRGFGGDLSANDNALPVSGLWADEAFFKVFSFQLVQGSPSHALKEPYSLVLTESASRKIFGNTDVLGTTVKIDTATYLITGVMKDVPNRSHLQFEMLASFSTIEKINPDTDGDFFAWNNIYMNYIYLSLPENNDVASVQQSIDKLCRAENASLKDQAIFLWLQPLSDIPFHGGLANELGGVFHSAVLWILGGLAFVVILSASFNYTNLSVARAFRRSREVGIRKVIGASRSNVIFQFITESIIISLLALVISFLLFIVLRRQFLFLHPFLSSRFALEITPSLLLSFIALAFIVGIISGFLPALFFSRIQASKVLKDVSGLKVFRHVTMRKVLIATQYTFSLIFITATIIGYRQYHGFISHDLGFETKNIVNINITGSNASAFIKELSEIPEVQGVSKSVLITSLGNKYAELIKYKNDSSRVMVNLIDEIYLPLHKHQFIAGKNFSTRTETATETEVIVNEELVKQFNLGERSPEKAIGEVININNKILTVVGVVKDFHYGTLQDKIEPMLFRNAAGNSYGYVNAKVITSNWPGTYVAIENAWKKVDKVHPLQATFYSEQIEEAYSQYSVMIKVIGFISFIAIGISSLGLFGMVVFTTETKLREISIRKVLGASEAGLVFLLSKSFLLLLAIAVMIAIPLTYLFFDGVVLAKFAYHQPIGATELLLSVGIVGGLAILLIGSQTFQAARRQPAEALKNE